MSNKINRLSYGRIIKDLRFSPPPRILTGVVAVAFSLLAFYDLTYYKTGLAEGTPAPFFILVPLCYLPIAYLLFFRSPLAIVSLWALFFILRFNPVGDQYWTFASYFALALVAYSMSPWFWLPTLVLAIYSFIPEFTDTFFSASNLWEIGRTIVPFFIIPILVRIRIEKVTSEKVAYEQQIEAALQAADEERRGLARELHDVVAHELTVIAMQTRTARYADSEGKDEVLALIGGQSRNALQELRRLLAVMRVEKDSKMLAPEHQSMSVNPVEMVSKQCKQLEDLGYQVTYKIEGDYELVPKSFAPTLLRVVNESVTNTIKHGRNGGKVDVYLNAGKENLEYSLTNETGKTKDQLQFPTSGFGLMGLIERVKPLGGTLESHALADNRWVMQLDIPYDT